MSGTKWIKYLTRDALPISKNPAGTFRSCGAATRNSTSGAPAVSAHTVRDDSHAALVMRARERDGIEEAGLDHAS